MFAFIFSRWFFGGKINVQIISVTEYKSDFGLLDLGVTDSSA